MSYYAYFGRDSGCNGIYITSSSILHLYTAIYVTNKATCNLMLLGGFCFEAFWFYQSGIFISSRIPARRRMLHGPLFKGYGHYSSSAAFDRIDPSYSKSAKYHNSTSSSSWTSVLILIYFGLFPYLLFRRSIFSEI